MPQLVRILRMQSGWHETCVRIMRVGTRCHMVQIINVNMSRVANCNSTAALKLAQPRVMRMHVIVVCSVRLSHVFGVVMRDGNHRNIAMGVWV